MSPGEASFKAPLWFARIALGVFAFGTLGLGAIILLLTRGQRADWSGSALVLLVYAGLAIAELALAVVVPELGARLSGEPWVYSVTTSLAYLWGFTVCGLGFVAAIITHSPWSYLGSVLVVYVLWALRWPSAAQWTRWQARRAAKVEAAGG